MVCSRLSTLLLSFLVLLSVVTAPTLVSGYDSTQADTTVQPSESIASLATGVDNPPLAAASQANNSSATQHENPERVDEEGDTAALERWYTRQLRSQLEQSSANLSEGDYENARALLGDEYNETLEEYADLAEQTSGSEDDEVASRLQNTTDSHREYVSAVEKYRQTQAAYEEAKENGNETRARKLARELERLATQINQTGSTLTRNYEAVENETESNLTDVQQSITNTSTNVTTQQTSVRRTEFTRTTLTVDYYTRNISFRDPLVVNGTLATVNGTRLENQTIAVSLRSQTAQTETTANGSFSLTVRPTLLPRGTQQITVRYLPKNTSVYLDSHTTQTVNVTATTPTVTLTHHPDRVEYNETLLVAGEVDVPNVTAGVNGVPVRIMFGSETLGTTQTTANGSFTLTASLPASVPAGEQQLRVLLPLSGQALSTATATTSLTVRPTPTQLTVSTDADAPSSPNRTQLRGQLRTENGTALPNQSIVIRVNDQTVDTVTTNDKGVYTTTLNTSALQETTNETSPNATAVFVGSGSLQQSRAATDVQVRPSSGPLSSLPVSPTVLGTGLLGLGALGALALRDLGFGGSEASTEVPQEEITNTAPAGTDSEMVAPTMADSQSILEEATTHLEADNDDDAVKLAYLAVRHHFTTSIDGLQDTAAQTHWEFYNMYRTNEDTTPEAVSHLKSLTEAFERAQFTTDALATEQATTAVETAADILSDRPTEQTDAATGAQ